MNTLVCVNLSDCVCMWVCVFVTLIVFSGLSVILSYTWWILVCMCVFRFVLLCEFVWKGWLTFECLSRHCAAACNCLTSIPVSLSLSLSLYLSGLFSCHCELMPVMDYSRTDANLSWYSRNSIPPYWDQLHRMLSPIVPYSEYTTHSCISHQTYPVNLVGLCLNQWASTPKISRSGHCVL